MDVSSVVYNNDFSKRHNSVKPSLEFVTKMSPKTILRIYDALDTLTLSSYLWSSENHRSQSPKRGCLGRTGRKKKTKKNISS